MLCLQARPRRGKQGRHSSSAGQLLSLLLHRHLRLCPCLLGHLLKTIQGQCVNPILLSC